MMKNLSLETQHVPEDFNISACYPNPFNPATNIRYDLPEAAHVFLAIYDVQGREIKRLLDGTQSAGYHTVTWDASNSGSGVYLYTMIIQNRGEVVLNKSGKMLMVK